MTGKKERIDALTDLSEMKRWEASVLAQLQEVGATFRRLSDTSQLDARCLRDARAALWAVTQRLRQLERARRGTTSAPPPHATGQVRRLAERLTPFQRARREQKRQRRAALKAAAKPARAEDEP